MHFEKLRSVDLGLVQGLDVFLQLPDIFALKFLLVSVIIGSLIDLVNVFVHVLLEKFEIFYETKSVISVLPQVTELLFDRRV